MRNLIDKIELKFYMHFCIQQKKKPHWKVNVACAFNDSCRHYRRTKINKKRNS